MASEETSSNQDAHAQVNCRKDQPAVNHEDFEHTPTSSASEIQEEYLDFNTSDLSLFQTEQESHTATTTMVFTLPGRTSMSATSKELCLQKELRIQRLQHQLYEEHFQHLIKVKELSYKLSAPHEAPEELMPRMSLTAHPPSAVATASNIIVSDNNSNTNIPIANPSCALGVELIKKLHSQRLQQQIEIEEAIHKLKMKQLLTLNLSSHS